MRLTKVNLMRLKGGEYVGQTCWVDHKIDDRLVRVVIHPWGPKTVLITDLENI